MKFKVGDRVRCVWPVEPWYGRAGIILEVKEGPRVTSPYLTDIKNERAPDKCNTWWGEHNLELSNNTRELL
jgi:hypothetical protein